MGGASTETQVDDTSKGGKSKPLDPSALYKVLGRELEQAKEAKTYKYEVPIESDQAGVVMADGRLCVMLASNNYLGLANHGRIKAAASYGLERYGYGMASVRFICGTQKIHLELEERIAQFLGTEAAILHSSCFAANEAFFTGLMAHEFGQSGYRDIIYWRPASRCPVETNPRPSARQRSRVRSR